MTAGKYTPRGRGHKVLGQLSEQPHGRRELSALEENDRTRRKLPYLLAAMLTDGVIYQSAGEYRLTDEGVALLEHLDRQVMSMRAYARAAA